MTPPLLGVEEEGHADVSVIGSSPSVDCVSRAGAGGVGLKERNYLGLSESSVDSSAASSLLPEENGINLNLKATELRLALPGSQSPERDPEVCLLSPRKLDEKALFPLVPLKDGICSETKKSVVVSGNKRGYADTMDGLSEVKNSVGHGHGHVLMSTRSSVTQSAALVKETPKVLQERTRAANQTGQSHPRPSSKNNVAPAAKAQVVGWPPIRSCRMNTLASTSKKNEEVDGKPGPGALFVKVSMDGAPYLRKVDLRTYSSYQEMSSALEKMFSCFTIGQCGSHGAPGREMLSESKLRDLLHGSEYVLTYEDKDGDWMLVGDVPWEMFIDSCKRLKIMKSSDAIGLAPRAMEKSKNRA